VRRFAAAPWLILAASLIGCSGGIALRPIQAPCPTVSVDGPSWSPDGTKIAYFEDPHWNGTNRLHVIDVISGSTTHLADIPAQTVAPQWSPDGSNLLTASESGTYEYELMTFDLEGTQQILPEHIPGTLHYRWSPGGEQFALTYQGPGESDLFVFDQHGTSLWRLSDLRPDLIWPSSVEWSPDGTRLAFADSSSRPGRLVTISASGEDIQIHSTPGERVVDVLWSPDGRWIAFTVLGSTNGYELYVTTPGGRNLTMIANEPIRYLRWLPDSSDLIYMDASNDIVIISRDAGPRTIVSSQLHGGTLKEADFSPDTTQIAYTVGGRYGADDLYVMNVDGTNVQQLTDNPGNHKCFQWPF
jgi:Tol biopolymer transport system component